MAIKIFVTGGTIDGLEYDSPEKAPKHQKTHIPDALKQSRVTVDYDIEVLMFKDSKFVTNEDRETIRRRCQEFKEDCIIITHGSATMSETAKYLGKNNITKTIILLGSAYPVNKKNTDALFNLGAALTAVQILPKGVYVTMNGKIFTWDNVKKNFKSGFFEKEK